MDWSGLLDSYDPQISGGVERERKITGGGDFDGNQKCRSGDNGRCSDYHWRLRGSIPLPDASHNEIRAAISYGDIFLFNRSSDSTTFSPLSLRETKAIGLNQVNTKMFAEGRNLSGYDPLELSERIEDIVVQGRERKYYRFRGAKFYGGIATADCVGCNLSCYFCWSDKPRKKPREVGNFYTPNEVAEKLVSIAEENGFNQVRISGNEPTLGRKHLLSVLNRVENSGLNFILETNGVLIGADPSYARDLAKFGNLHVRVSLKGCDPDQFFELTGGDPDWFDLQLQSLRNLMGTGCRCHASVMGEFASQGQLTRLKENLREINHGLSRFLELEELKLYPHVKRRLKEKDLL